MKNAKPVSFHKPVSVAIHWRDEVKQELERDAVGTFRKSGGEQSGRMVC